MPGKVKTSWKPGQSGNPKGRPTSPLKTAIQKSLEERHWTRVDGKRRLMTKNEILIQVLWEHARKGDPKAIQMLWDRGYGKPQEFVEHSGEINSGVVIVERAAKRKKPKS